jgi:hypothetical protein
MHAWPGWVLELETAGVDTAGQDLEEWSHVERFASLDAPVVVVAAPCRSLPRAAALAAQAHRLGLSGVAPNDGYASGVLPGMLVTDLGCGLSLPALTIAAGTGTTEGNAGLGSAVFSSVQQVGGAVALGAILPAVLLRPPGARTP